MNFLNRLTGAGRTMVIIVIVAIAGAVLYFSGATNKLASSKLFKNDGTSLVSTADKGEYDATLAVNTYCGFEPIVWANGGLKGSNDSYLYKKYGIK